MGGWDNGSKDDRDNNNGGNIGGGDSGEAPDLAA